MYADLTEMSHVFPWFLEGYQMFHEGRICGHLPVSAFCGTEIPDRSVSAEEGSSPLAQSGVSSQKHP